MRLMSFGFLILLFVSACAHRGFGPRVIDVQGQCFREVSPDRGQVDLTHVVLDKTIESAARVAGERYEKLKKDIETLGLKELELRTLQYSVSERREWEKDRQVSKGFEARISLRVISSDIARMGEVLQLAGNSKVEEVGSLQMLISTALRESERSECLKQAVQDASRKAAGMAASLNASIGKVLHITEEGAQPYAPARMEMMMMGDANPMAKSARGAAPQLEGGKEELRFAVSVSFQLR